MTKTRLLNNMGLTNKYVDKLCKDLKLDVVGVYPCDKLKKIKKYESIIINLDTSNMPGSHFVCLYHSGKSLVFFDSFNLDCTNLYIINYINSYKCQVLNCSYQLQSYLSYFCGYFCVAFIIFCKLSKSAINQKIHEFYSLFDFNKLSNNDKIVENFIKKYITHL